MEVITARCPDSLSDGQAAPTPDSAPPPRSPAPSPWHRPPQGAPNPPPGPISKGCVLIRGINVNNKNLAGKVPLPSKSPQWQNRGRPGGRGGCGQAVSSFVTPCRRGRGTCGPPGLRRPQQQPLSAPGPPRSSRRVPPPPTVSSPAPAQTLGVPCARCSALSSFPGEEPPARGELTWPGAQKDPRATSTEPSPEDCPARPPP